MINEIIAGTAFLSASWYWLTHRDTNLEKLCQIFETNNIKSGAQIPRFSKRRGNVYLFRLPIGMSFDQIKAKEQVFRDAFPNKAVEIEFKRTLRIVIADPLTKTATYDGEPTGWRIPIGRNVERTVFHDFRKYPHLLVAGMTRYGKTVFLKLLISSIVAAKPKASQLVLIDMKGGLAFNRFSALNQTKWLATNVDEAIRALLWVADEAKRRQQYFLANSVEKIEDLTKPYTRIFVIVDEAAELTMQGRRGKDAQPYQECERLLSYIARVGAGLGIHLIYCTQYPTAATLPQQIKQNCDATISFRLRNSTASRVVFDESGKAEDLPPIPGRAIYRTDRDIELQVFYIDDERIDEIIAANKREVNDVEPPTDEGSATGGDIIIFK